MDDNNIITDDSIIKDSIIGALDVIYDSVEVSKYGVLVGAIISLMVGVYSSFIGSNGSPSYSLI